MILLFYGNVGATISNPVSARCTASRVLLWEWTLVPCLSPVSIHPKSHSRPLPLSQRLKCPSAIQAKELSNLRRDMGGRGRGIGSLKSSLTVWLVDGRAGSHETLSQKDKNSNSKTNQPQTNKQTNKKMAVAFSMNVKGLGQRREQKRVECPKWLANQ